MSNVTDLCTGECLVVEVAGQNLNPLLGLLWTTVFDLPVEVPETGLKIYGHPCVRSWIVRSLWGDAYDD